MFQILSTASDHAHNSINSHTCKSQKRHLLYLHPQNISVTPFQSLYKTSHQQINNKNISIGFSTRCFASWYQKSLNFFLVKYGVERQGCIFNGSVSDSAGDEIKTFLAELLKKPKYVQQSRTGHLSKFCALLSVLQLHLDFYQ